MDMNVLRRVILYLCALVLVALAVFQSTDPPHGQAIAIGVATKIVTAMIAVMVAYLTQPPEA